MVAPLAPGGLSRQPGLPLLPRTPDQVLEWIAAFDRSYRSGYTDITARIQFYVTQASSALTGSTTPVAGAGTSVAISFAGQEADAAYLPLMVTDWNTTHWYSALSTTGFTANFGTAAPGGGGNLRWVIVR